MDAVDNIGALWYWSYSGSSCVINANQVLDDPHVLRRLRLRNINHLVRYIRDNQTISNFVL